MEDLNDKITGGSLSAPEWNQVPSEIQNAIEGLGQILSAGDLDQLGKGIAGYVANGIFYTDSGVADAYVLTQIGLKQAPTAYTDGMKAEFKPGNTNAGASTVNVAGLGVKNISGTSGGEIEAGFIVTLIYNNSSGEFEIFSTTSATVTGIQNFAQGIGASYMQNMSIEATVAANALTVSGKGKDGNDFSVTNQGQVAFRESSLTDGKYSIVNITSAASVVAPAGATLGFIADEDGYVYVYGMDVSGTLEYAICKRAVFDESILHTSVSISAGSDDDETLYSTTGRVDVPIRLLARLRIITGATPGNWSNAPIEKVPWSTFMKKTGDIVQIRTVQDGEVATGTTILPFDDTIPVNTEGDQYMSKAITFKSSINKAVITSGGYWENSGGGTDQMMALFQDAVANAIAVGVTRSNFAGQGIFLTLRHEMITGTISSTTFKLRSGAGVGGTTTFNGVSGVRKFGGVLSSFLSIMEIQQ